MVIPSDLGYPFAGVSTAFSLIGIIQDLYFSLQYGFIDLHESHVLVIFCDELSL